MANFSLNINKSIQINQIVEQLKKKNQLKTQIAQFFLPKATQKVRFLG